MFCTRIISSKALAGPARQLRASTRRLHTAGFRSQIRPRIITKSNLLVGLVGVSVGAIAYNDVNDFKPLIIHNDAAAPVVPADNAVQVDSSINSFPVSIVSPADGGTKFSLIGHGIRKVTFVNFKVYGLGIYIADEDAKKVPEVFNSAYLSKVFIDKLNPSLPHSENLLAALKDPEVSEVLVNSLLDANVRFLVRIVPLRDTDFNHLRDGFVKSCVRNKLAKSQYPDKLNQGVDEIRDIFKKYRAKCPKNHVFLVETDKQGKTSFAYEDYGKHPEKGLLKETVQLGTVQEEVVSKALLLNYFAGSKPISEDARQRSIESFARLV